MTNPIMWYDPDMAEDNLLLAQANIQVLIDAAVLAAQPTFDNGENYDQGDIVYSGGLYYYAKVNINLGGGLPVSNSDWVQCKNWGGYNTTVSANGTTTLTTYSETIQRLTGSSDQIFKLPVVSTLPALGIPFIFINDSTGTATIQSSGSNTVLTLLAGERCTVNCVSLTGTTAASWTYTFIGTALTAQNLGDLIQGLTQKATPIDADRFSYWDSVADIAKYALGSDIKAWLKTYNDTLYDNIKSYQTIATAAGTTTLTVSSPSETFFTGSTTQNCDMPVCSTLYTGWQRRIVNNSTGLVTIRSSGGNTILVLAPSTSVDMICILASGTSAASWQYIYKGFNVASGKVVTINNSITINGTDGTTHTMPGTSSSLARTDAAQTFNGTQTLANYMLLGENSGILEAQTLSADGKFSISRGLIGTLGETLSVGHLVYYKESDGRFWKADSDSESTSGPVLLAIVCVAGNAGDDVQLMLQGRIRADSLFPTLTRGAPVYIGSTSGAIQVAAPTSGFIRVIGYGDTADSLNFCPEANYYEKGTFTVGVSFGGGTTGITYGTRQSNYIKDSDKINCISYCAMTNKGSSTGAAKISGIPFASNASVYSPVTVWFSALTYSGTYECYLAPSDTNIIVQQVTEAGTNSNLTDANFSNTTEFMLNLTYLK